MLEYLDNLIGRDGLFERDLVSFPDGNNDTDTVLGGNHFNLTTLEHWNYTLYSNGTLSNWSKCWLVYEPYQPALLYQNGSFVNATKCYSAVDPIGVRGYTGIGMAVGFGLCLVGVLTCLAKHGKIYLRKESRFYPIGRRWQWYWGAFTCAAALISLFINVDVDRYHVQELPLIVTVFFYYMICWGTVALVWEAVRHWGSWLQRQYVDPDPFIVNDEDRRAKIEFFLPLWFYFWLWLVCPRLFFHAEQLLITYRTSSSSYPEAGISFPDSAPPNKRSNMPGLARPTDDSRRQASASSSAGSQFSSPFATQSSTISLATVASSTAALASSGPCLYELPSLSFSA